MGKIIAIANQKEVGKTTTSVNLAASLGVLEKDLIDADPQANASSGLGIDVDNIEIGTFLEHSNTPREAIIKCSAPNVDIIPSHIDLVAIEIELVDKENRNICSRKHYRA
jgi:chromosome partitioning protein